MALFQTLITNRKALIKSETKCEDRVYASGNTSQDWILMKSVTRGLILQGPPVKKPEGDYDYETEGPVDGVLWRKENAAVEKDPAKKAKQTDCHMMMQNKRILFYLMAGSSARPGMGGLGLQPGRLTQEHRACILAILGGLDGPAADDEKHKAHPECLGTVGDTLTTNNSPLEDTLEALIHFSNMMGKDAANDAINGADAKCCTDEGELKMLMMTLNGESGGTDSAGVSPDEVSWVLTNAKALAGKQGGAVDKTHLSIALGAWYTNVASAGGGGGCCVVL